MDMLKDKCLWIAGCRVYQYSHFGKQLGGFSENWKQNCLMPQLYLLWAYTHRTLQSMTDTSTPLFLHILFTIARKYNQPWSLRIDECIKNVIHLKEQYSSIKKEIIELAGKLTELGKILNEVTWFQKDKCHMFFLRCRSCLQIHCFVCLAWSISGIQDTRRSF